jgi:hypothetical protein
MKIFYSVLLIIFIIFSSSAQYTTKTGLYFSSHETVQDYRTSLKISPEKRLDLEKGMTLSFDISFRPGDGDYGYVVRIIGDAGVHLDLVAHTTSQSTNFWLVNQDSTLFSLGWKDLKDIHYDQWVEVKINIDPLREEISLKFHDWEQKKKLPQIKGISHPTIVFGAQKEPNLVSTDVAPMTLRHIRIADHTGEVLRHWELSKHVENLVYDEISGAAAEVLKPACKIHDHVKWRQVGHLNKKNIVRVCTDALNNRVIIIVRHTLSIYKNNRKKIL